MADFSKAKQYVMNLLESDLSKGFLYHDKNHTLDVYRSAKELGELAQLQIHDQVLLETAALFHDVGLIYQYDGHEEKSGEIVREKLPDYDYSAEDIELIIGMINSTKLPQNPQTFLEELLCDADLDYLGRDDFFVLAARLQLEWRRLKVRDISFDEWIAFEKEFLSNHRYFTSAARERRDRGKEDNLRQLRNICNRKN